MLPIAVYNIKAIWEGGLSLLSGSGRFFHKGTSGTDSARYCYSVWLRHLVKIHAYQQVPLDGVVVELGPGDSLGIGLAALLSGASHYVAVDAIQHANTQQNMKVFEELISLISDRAPIPSNQEFPEVKPRIDDFRFPASIFEAGWMEKNLDSKRLQTIADSLNNKRRETPMVQYIDPSEASSAIAPSSVDIVFSQAVLEHTEDLSSVYRACRAWLKPGGLMSHQIDFRSHGTSREWNGHWVYPEVVWRLIRGNRPYLLNREPCSTHLRMLAQNGFQIVVEEPACLSSRLQRSQLAVRFRNMPQQDLTTAGIYILAEKRKLEQQVIPKSSERTSCAALQDF